MVIEREDVDCDEVPRAGWCEPEGDRAYYSG